jgi:two-component system sensor histidine kinase TctE
VKRQLSLRARLLLGILLPVTALVSFNTVSLYGQALAASDTAYDRTLLASAKSIGELLHIVEAGGTARLRSEVAYSALEAFEADNRSRIFYKVIGFDGEVVSGFADLPAPRGDSSQPNVYAALVRFYDDVYDGTPVRMAVLLQPVAGVEARGMAMIQVAETLDVRKALARTILIETAWRQALLLGVIAAVVIAVVQRATRPVRDISARLRRRREGDLTPLSVDDAPQELRPVLEATNGVMSRLSRLLSHQKRFVRDASHQLRTPLAVLTTQVQSARRGDVAPEQALAEIGATVAGATDLANQMLALAKVEQLRVEGHAPVTQWPAVIRAVAVELSPLIAEARLDFEMELHEAAVRAHEWSLRELSRNLLHNAIRHCPPGGRLALRMPCDARTAALVVSDSGPGIGDELRQRLFEPFAAASHQRGSGGLGLVICHEIVESLGGSIDLVNREHAGRVLGLDAVVRLPLAQAQGTTGRARVP